ncbi:MAG: acetyltransferase, partial [Gammaproteobacteria bacterium]|nr:acetyltransferase [Gammaproteobacteria bacterium]
VGKGVFISSAVVIDVHFPDLIEIQDYVILGYGARIFTHEFSDATYTLGRVVIGEGTVVGAFASIRGGVTIGKNVTVPINKVVSRNIEQKQKVRG